MSEDRIKVTEASYDGRNYTYRVKSCLTGQVTELLTKEPLLVLDPDLATTKPIEVGGEYEWLGWEYFRP